MAQSIELLTYVNGRIMPHSQASPLLQRINASSVGGYYDAERTFGGKVFKLKSHLERLYRGLEASKIDPRISLDELERITLGVIEANLSLLPDGDEFTVTQIVNMSQPQSPDDAGTINVVVYCQPLDFTRFARSYLDGVRIVTPNTYGVPPGQEPGADKSIGQQAFLLMASPNGGVSECQGANFMFVKDGRIKLPDRRNVLPGVSMQTVLELAESLNIPVDEGTYTQRHIYAADEAFVSSTRYCIVPVSTLNGLAVGGSIPGEVTTALLESWSAAVGMDFVNQALSHL
ncbi:MAG: aminotransferase class IV [Chloroflexi bacterium]|nr:aminotransferase class IV [Chloroflexota bacterium]